MTKRSQPLKALWFGITAVLVVFGFWFVASRFGVVKPPITLPAVRTSEGGKHSQNAYTKDDPAITAEQIGPRKHKVIDIHEHVLNEEEAQRLLVAMDALGVQRTCILAATTYTFTLNPIFGFEGFKENNETVIAIKKKWPSRFCAFVTLNPVDEGNLELLKDYVARGADGLKLYLGHGASTGKGPFHVMPLDDARMEPIWAWAEEVQLPIVMHVNLIKYWDESLRLLEKHPYLRISFPHFGLHKNSEARLKRLSWLLKRYPNFYTDESYGYYTFQLEGFEAFAKFRTRSRAFLDEHKDKIMFASDMVLEPTKDEPYIMSTLRSYMQFNEMERFRLFLVPKKIMWGMGLQDTTLRAIYEEAPARFLMLDDKGQLPDRTHGWPVAGLAVPPRPPIPPLDPNTIPPDTTNGPLKAKPSTDGPPADDADATGSTGGEPEDDEGEEPVEPCMGH